MQKIHCAEVWGGVLDVNKDLLSSGVEVSLFSSAANNDKGGDIYYVSSCGNNLLTRIVVADVTGHGEAASITSQWLLDVLREQMNALDGSVVLSEVNTRAVEYGYKAITTAAVVAFYRDTRRLYYASAGHYPILLRQSGSNIWVSLKVPSTNSAKNVPLGVAADTRYSQVDTPLRKDELVMLYTDGLLEAKNPQGEQFGEQGLLTTLRGTGGCPSQVKEAVLDALYKHIGHGNLTDDVTFVVLKAHV